MSSKRRLLFPFIFVVVLVAGWLGGAVALAASSSQGTASHQAAASRHRRGTNTAPVLSVTNNVISWPSKSGATGFEAATSTAAPGASRTTTYQDLGLTTTFAPAPVPGATRWYGVASEGSAGNLWSSNEVEIVWPPNVTSVPQPVGVPHPGGGSWPMAFDDEFNGTSLDTTKWSAMEGYTNNNVTDHGSNVTVANGNLQLALPSATSGALVDSGPEWGPGHGYLFPVGGYLEARILFPGSGATVYNWPTFWETDTHDWPASGEIDIAEGWAGQLSTNYHATGINTGSYWSGGPWTNAYHVIGMYRDAASLGAGHTNNAYTYLDGTLIQTTPTSDNGAPHDIMINTGSVNTGSGWTPLYGAGATVHVDWVRAWT
jgi:hypothetical protein